jgi:hypothetical protein
MRLARIRAVDDTNAAGARREMFSARDAMSGRARERSAHLDVRFLLDYFFQ